MTATTVFTAGQVLSASALNGNFSKLANAQAAGTATATTGGLAGGATVVLNITYPSSRFAVAPILTVSTTSPRYVCGVTTNTAGSATITVLNVTGTTGSDATLYYQAVQMGTAAAAG